MGTPNVPVFCEQYQLFEGGGGRDVLQHVRAVAPCKLNFQGEFDEPVTRRPQNMPEPFPFSLSDSSIDVEGLRAGARLVVHRVTCDPGQAPRVGPVDLGLEGLGEGPHEWV